MEGGKAVSPFSVTFSTARAVVQQRKRDRMNPDGGPATRYWVGGLKSAKAIESRARWTRGPWRDKQLSVA